MDFKTLNIKINGNFDAKSTFECGQCFRWREVDENLFEGVVEGEYAQIFQDESLLEIKATGSLDEKFWEHYLALDEPYDTYQSILSSDEFVKKSIEYTNGIRIMKQRPWETLISFILSSNNNIKRISGSIEKLSEKYGSQIQTWNKKIAYAFPTAGQLEGISAEEYKTLGVGYRDKYLVDAVDKILSGEVNLESIIDMEYKEAKKELMKIKGVGSKVADCVLLFGFDFKEAFPIDVWVKRVMLNLYENEIDSEKQIAEFASNHFGKYGGIAQQYLFHYARSEKDFFDMLKK